LFIGDFVGAALGSYYTNDVNVVAQTMAATAELQASQVFMI
jgi:hypothetical protein